MQFKTILIGAFALVFGISAAVGAYLLVQNPAAAPGPETVSVVIAAMDISRGQTISTDQLTQHEWPKDAAPEGAIVDKAIVIDRTAKIAIIKGDVVSETKLAPIGAGQGLAAVIPAGMRAVTIQTPNVATGVAGFILPGNRVDVLLTFSSNDANDSSGGGSTVTLLQNVEILAVDQSIEAPQDNKMDLKELRSVTLLVTPSGAARLDLGQNKGTLRLTLRNFSDTDITSVEPATLAELRTGTTTPAFTQVEESLLQPFLKPVVEPVAEPVVVTETQPVPPPRIKPPMMIRTLRGSSHGYIQFPQAEQVPSTDHAANGETTAELETARIDQRTSVPMTAESVTPE